MKSEDFDRLKSVCEKEGFELLNLNHEDNDKYFVIAKKIPERVNVEPFNLANRIHGKFLRMEFTFSTKNSDDIKLNGAQIFLASQLEKYLNGEIE